MRGVYCLIVSVLCGIEIQVGALGVKEFPAGIYLYVGSALNGIEARINRHIRINSGGVKGRPHWHIDYLLREDEVRIEGIWFKETVLREECEIARAVSRHGQPIAGFGCSDCKCASHLFKVKSSDFLRELELRPWEEKNL